MGKYKPLTGHLRAIPASQRTITLSFRQINEIIGRAGKGHLPKSAYVYGKQGYWFNNAGSRQGRAWLCAGWEVRDVRVSNNHEPSDSWVTFRRR